MGYAVEEIPLLGLPSPPGADLVVLLA